MAQGGGHGAVKPRWRIAADAAEEAPTNCRSD
jgi:hypothetical protein